MLGAIIGDIIGSTRKWNNIKTEDFEFVPEGSHFTDVTVMTLAVAEWLMDDPDHKANTLVNIMQSLGRKYPHAGYSTKFRKWLNSEHPKPYGSYGNGSAMRVSPVGLYANSLEEALELARITASVTHDHLEGIKGAQAIAASIYIKLHAGWGGKSEIKHIAKEKFGYNLDIRLEDIRDNYGFNPTCQSCVPIAIMSYLQRDKILDTIRLAVSMGGDSNVITSMETAILAAEPFYTSPFRMPDGVIEKCRNLLSKELRDINDRFEAFISRPIYQSYYLGARNVFGGEYPGDKQRSKAEAKIKQMVHFGVRHFVDLTEEGELVPYSQLLPKSCTYTRLPICDVSIPQSIYEACKYVRTINELSRLDDGYVYIHCWGGVGRTGTISACWLAEIMEEPSFEKVMERLRSCFSSMPKSAYRTIPDTRQQEEFIRKYVNGLERRDKEQKHWIHDCVRGSLMAGAAGDVLGYPVKSLSRKSIISRYGNNGITEFDLDSNGKTLVSDATQMTLFTANGMLMGFTRGQMRGIGGQPENYIDGAYIDWYYTQTGKKEPMLGDSDFHYTWLRDLPEKEHRRDPDNTCLTACESLMHHKRPNNNSKGCGGIMRVAPMGLFDTSFDVKNKRELYNTKLLAEAGAKIAKTTHLNPLGYLPAAMLTVLISKIVPLTPNEVKESISVIVNDCIDVMEKVEGREHIEEKEYLKSLTLHAMELAQSDKSDYEAISELGEGWTADEAWAISLYCSVRHIDSMRDAIIAAVNHDGASNSIGSITGNVMGAIYGYEAIKKENLFCPRGYSFESTIELHNIIMALADDLYTGCEISEYAPIDTPEKRQWYMRYCEMKPVGINNDNDDQK